MQNFIVKTHSTGLAWAAYVIPTDTSMSHPYCVYSSLEDCFHNSKGPVFRDFAEIQSLAIGHVLYQFASYCIKNSLTSDCIEAEQRDRLQVYIEQINRTGEFSQ